MDEARRDIYISGPLFTVAERAYLDPKQANVYGLDGRESGRFLGA